MNKTAKRLYQAPLVEVLVVDTADRVCGIGTGSNGTDEGGLAKDHTTDGSLWEDDEDFGEPQSND